MANEQKRRRIINSRNAPKSGKTFGGSSAPSETVSEKSSLRYGLKDMPKKDVPAEKSSLRYGLKDMPKDTSSTTAVKDKMVSGLEKSAKKVPAYEAIKGATASKVDSSLGGMAARGLGRVAGPAAMAMGAKDLYDSYKKYDKLMPGTKPNMSKKSDPIVDAINSDSDASTRAKSRGANREAMYGSQKDVSKESSPDVEIKKTEIVKTAPVASRKTTPSVSKPKASTSGMGGIDRAALEEFRNSYDKEQRPQLDALREYTDNIKLRDAADTENARTKTEATEASEYKKGGMTKRPPKPAKKVPPRKFASGGSVSRTSASKRGDGCATKGHTKGKYL